MTVMSFCRNKNRLPTTSTFEPIHVSPAFLRSVDIRTLAGVWRLVVKMPWLAIFNEKDERQREIFDTYRFLKDER